MLLESHDKLFGNTEANNLKQNSAFLRKKRNYCFKILGKIFKSKYSLNCKLRTQIIFESLINWIIALQMISMTWYPNMGVKGWNNYSSFWNFINYFDFNNLSQELGIAEYWFYTNIAVLTACILSVILLFVLNIFDIKLPRLFLYALKKTLVIFVSIFYIPSLVQLTMAFKYSALNYSKIEEFSDNLDSSILDYGVFGAIFSIFLIIFLVSFAFFAELLTVDIRHVFARRSITTRSHSSLDLQLLVFRTSESLVYVLLGKQNIEWYQIFLLFFSALIALEGTSKLPYYNKIENTIKICRYFCIVFWLIIFLIGNAMNNATIIFALNIFVQPPLVLIISRYINTRFNQLQTQPISYENQYDFEKTMRHRLCDKKLADKLQVLNSFSICYKNKKFRKNKLFVIWEVNFCLYILNDERLARIKLTKINTVTSSLEGDIQEWRALKDFKERDNDLADINYLEYLDDLDKIKRQDEEICCTLIDLWSEFSSKFPQYKKIYRLSIRTSQLLTQIKTFYEKLIAKHKHIQIFELYSTFLDNILGEPEQANIINRKKASIKTEINPLIGEDKLLSAYGENNGIILISVNSSNLGAISYINQKAAHILKGSVSDLVGMPFHNFIPFPYCVGHDEYMREFYLNCTSTEIIKRGGLFLQNTVGYLVECKFLIRLTAFSNLAYFLVSLRPRHTSRQICLVSEQGLIYNYTELFPHYIGSRSQNIRNSVISEFVPNLNLQEMNIFDPWITLHRGQEIALIHTIKKFKTTIIHLFVIVHDEKELLLWRNGQDNDQIEYFQNTQLYDEEENSPDTSPENSIIKQIKVKFRRQKDTIISLKSLDDEPETTTNGAFDNTLIDDLKDIEVADDRSASVAQGSSLSNSSTAIANRYIDNLLNKLQFFQWILLFSTLAAIGTSVGILVYIYEDTSHTSSLSVFSTFGSLMYNLMNSADLARSIDNEIRYGVYNLTRDFGLFGDTINNIKELRNFILSDYDEWSYCQSSEIVKEDILPMWFFSPSSHISKYNLFDGIAQFISHGDNLYNLLSHGNYSLNEVKFIVLNSLGFTFQYASTAMQNLVDCETVRIQEIGTNITALLFLGIGILMIFVGALIGYVININKNYDEFWNFIKKVSFLSCLELKRACIERLVTVHGINYEIDGNFEMARPKKMNVKIKSKIYLKFVWRLCIILAISSAYYTVSKFYLYDKCEESLINRPKLLHNMVYKRSLLSRMSVFARDCTSPSNLLWYTNSYGFKNSRTEYNWTSMEFKHTNYDIRQKNFLKLMSDDMKRRIFENWDSENAYLKFGTFAASNLMFLDSINIAAKTGLRPIPEYAAYIGNVSALQYALESDFDDIDQDSKNIITQEVNWLIYVNIAFSIVLALIFLLYYLPFIAFEKKSLRKLQVLASVIPNTKIDTDKLKNKKILKH
ncbi:unnamed protein product [Blepharisma stoltei]|uniref:TmcB/TmcC TPR repeats domain-containing protein n=1 Tax=Blepharisma stoltei TaxID=1481888 RepID=A0AAU9JMS5_9CILI|nr:unnamed protein product [Blepharisma stoltei]